MSSDERGGFLKAEMKVGDVVILEADDSWISKSIALLTDSSVSHAAMIYEPDRFIEMGLSGIGVHGFHEAAGGREAYIRRLSPEKDAGPLVAAARGYLDQGVKYDMPSLFLLAGLLVYRHMRPTPRLGKVTNFILRKVCGALDALINRIVNPKEAHLMVCSQLVYQCYHDCGKDYALRIRHGLLQDTKRDDGAIRLVDCLDGIGHSFAELDAAVATELAVLSDEALLKELCEALGEAKDVARPVLASRELGSVLNGARNFLELVEKLLEKLDIDLPVEALFVTPADLLAHCENLRNVCVCKLEYDGA